MPRRLPPRPRERPEIAELRQLKERHPELTSAIDLQIELLGLQQRIQARVPLPAVVLTPARIQADRAAGRPLLRFHEIPFEWTDVRLAVRETAELLRRYDVLDAADYQRAQALARDDTARLKAAVAAWYEGSPSSPGEPPRSAGLEHVLTLALRPFLSRSADALLAGADLGDWRPSRCPLCGGEPEFATITPSAERWLICGRCTGLWRYDPVACPFCENPDRQQITSFTSRDGPYRIYACNRCRRYLKAYDGRGRRRPVRLAVDTIATLPLDAATMQHGYHA